MKKILPPLILFFLAPAVGELLSASAPPVEFFSPFGLTVLPILYGGGAILARELVIRREKSWASLFILGGAYGIIEEGLMVKSFFDPNWVDLGMLGSYGRLAGVNWVWSVELTIYHAVVSIAVPILLVEMMFPDRRNDSWLNRGWLVALAILFTLDVAAGHFLMTSYRPEVIASIITIFIVAGLILLAWRLPGGRPATSEKPSLPPFLFWLPGFFGTLGFFILFTALPSTALHPVLTLLTGCLWVAGCGWLALKMAGSGTGMNDLHRLALAAGILSVFILFAPIREFGRGQNDNPAGMSIVGAAALVLILFLRWKIKRREHLKKSISHI